MPLRRFLSLVFATLPLGTFASLAWAAPPVDTILPPTTAMLLETDHVPAVRKAWKETSLGKLFDDPAMQPFMDELDQKNDAKDKGRIPPLGLWWEDILDLSAGQVAMAIVPDGNKQSSFVLWLDTTGNAATVVRIRQRLALDYSRRKARTGSLTVEGTPVTIYQYREGPAADDPLETRYYFLKENQMVVAESEFVVRDLLARWAAGTKDHLASRKAYISTTTALAAAHGPSDSIVRCFLDPFGLHDLRHKPKETDAKKQTYSKPDTMELLAENGFRVIQGIGGIVSFDANERDLLYQVKIYAPGELTDAAKMLTFLPAGELSPPDWFPADVSSVSSLQWNLPEAFSGYGSWFDADQGEQGDFEAILESIKLDKRSPQVDIKADMVGQLTGPVFSAAWTDLPDIKAEKDKKQTSHWLYAVKTKDEKTVSTALRKMLDGDPDIKTPVSKIGTTDVWVYRPDGAEAWFGPNLSNVALTVMQGYAIVASDFETMKNVLASTSAPLVKDGAWQKSKAELGKAAIDKPAVNQFRRLNLSLAETYALLQAGKIQEDDSLLGQAITLWLDQLVSRKKVVEQKPAAGGQRPLIPLNNQIDPPHDLNFTKLPAFSSLQKYLGHFAAETELTPEGWQQTGIILAP